MPFTDLDTTGAHIRHGIKTALAAVLSYGITLLFSLKFGFWAVLSAVIVMQVNVADSIQMCWYRFSGTAVGALIGMICIYIFPDTVPWTAVSLFCAVGFCAYMTRFNSRYKMAAITVVIVILASVGEENRFLFSLYRVLEIGIGVGCAFVVSILLWPLRAGSALRERVKRQYDSSAATYHALVEAFLTLQTKVSPTIMATLDRDLQRNKDLLRKVQQHELLVYGDNTALLSLQIETLEKCSEHMHALVHTLNDVDSEGYCLIMEKEVRDLAATCETAMKSMAAGTPFPLPTLAHALQTADERLAELRAEGATRRFALRKWVQVLSFLNTLTLLGYDLHKALKKRDSLQSAS